MRKILKNATRHLLNFKEQIDEIRIASRKISASSKGSKESGESRVTVDLSLSSIAKATIVALALFYLFQFVFLIGQVLMILFVSIIVASMLEPWVNWLELKRVPRVLGTLMFYVAGLIVVGFIVSYYIPLIASQILDLGRLITQQLGEIAANGEVDLPYGLNTQFDGLIASVTDLDVQQYIDNLYTGAKNFTDTAFLFLGSIFGGIAATITTLALAFYMIIDERAIEKFVESLAPVRHRDYTIRTLNGLKHKMGAWLRSQLLLCLIVGTIVWLGLSIIGVPYAATLGLIAGFTEFIPVIGPILAAIPAILIAMFHGPMMMFIVFVYFAILNSIESNLLVPLIMRHAVGLSPIIIILAMLIGGRTMGIGGVILAVPIAASISVFIQDYTERVK